MPSTDCSAAAWATGARSLRTVDCGTGCPKSTLANTDFVARDGPYRSGRAVSDAQRRVILSKPSNASNCARKAAWRASAGGVSGDVCGFMAHTLGETPDKTEYSCF